MHNNGYIILTTCLAGEEECTESALQSGNREIGVLANDGRCFASKFHQNWLQVLPGQTGNDGSYGRRSSKVDLPHRRVGDQGTCDLRAVLWTMDDRVQHAWGKANFVENVS